ncbi:hypothetical protein HH303_06705 [Rhodospirillaceae bacterium KN72]|uniref:FecR protein domain-containing protein n=1 Tax=Pacificispira spongiicola TaxID=2729598 RepID=A0A7Y0DYW3_9PROT|nr:FecR domain-containing protein [Pacificispira spongiicola]NMM44159.1 hypothetical protein [Pacificispira spongiicola]
MARLDQPHGSGGTGETTAQNSLLSPESGNSSDSNGFSPETAASSNLDTALTGNNSPSDGAIPEFDLIGGDAGANRPAVIDNPLDSGEPLDVVIALDARSGDSLPLSDASFIYDADYVRQGPDLLLIKPDGTAVLVENYFAVPSPPDLTAEGGRVLSPQLVQSFLHPIAPGQTAALGDAQVAQVLGESIGTVDNLTGNVYAVRPDGTRVLLQAGDPVYQGDQIETSDGASIKMTFVDGTLFTLGASARLALDEMVFDPTTQTGQSAFSILEGGFLFVSGQIAATNPNDMTVTTPVATIGIRGTVVTGTVSGLRSANGEAFTFTVVDGEIAVTAGNQTIVLSENFASATGQSDNAGQIRVFEFTDTAQNVIARNAAQFKALSTADLQSIERAIVNTIQQKTGETVDIDLRGLVDSVDDGPQQNQDGEEDGGEDGGQTEESGDGGGDGAGDATEEGDQEADAGSEEQLTEDDIPVEGEGDGEEELADESTEEEQLAEGEGDGTGDGDNTVENDTDDTAGDEGDKTEDVIKVVGDVGNGNDSGSGNGDDSGSGTIVIGDATAGTNQNTNETNQETVTVVQPTETVTTVEPTEITITSSNLPGASPAAASEGYTYEVNQSTSTKTVNVSAETATAPIKVTTGTGSDTVKTGSGADNVSTGAGNDAITTGAGNDTVNAGSGNDAITAGSGEGDDYYDGGDDYDTVKYPSVSGNNIANLTMSLNDSSKLSYVNDGSVGVIDNDTLTNVEKIESGEGDDLVYYYSTDMSIDVDGKGGSDSFTLSTSQDARYDFSSGLLTTSGGTATITNFEYVSTGSGNDTVVLTDHTTQYSDGGYGTDTLDYSKASQALYIATSSGQLGDSLSVGFDTQTRQSRDFSNFESVVGSNFGDTFSIATDGITIDGGAGNDTARIQDGAGTLTVGSSGNLKNVETIDLSNVSSTQSPVNLSFTASDVLSSTTGGTLTILGAAGGAVLYNTDFADWTETTSGSGTFTHSNGATLILDANAVSGLSVLSVGLDDFDVAGGQQAYDLSYTNTISTQDIVVNAGDTTLDLHVQTWSGNDTVTTGDGNDIIATAEGDDVIYAGAGNDYVTASFGNDTIVATAGGDGNDDYNGGIGTDTVTYASVTGNDIADLTLSINDVSADSFVNDGTANVTGFDTLTNVEKIISGDGDDVVSYFGTSLSIDVDAAGGSDTLSVNAGTSSVTYSFATGALSADGNTASATNFETISLSGSGNDTVVISDHTTQTAHGGDGTDTLNYAAASQAISVSVGSYINIAYASDSQQSTTYQSFENLVGSDFDDTFRLSSGTVTVDGGGGTDTLVLEDGAGTLTFGASGDIKNIEVLDLAYVEDEQSPVHFNFDADDILAATESGTLTILGAEIPDAIVMRTRSRWIEIGETGTYTNTNGAVLVLDGAESSMKGVNIFTGAVNSSWNNSANWVTDFTSSGTPPANGDDVELALNSTDTAMVSEIGSLSLNSLTGSGNLSMYGQATLSVSTLALTDTVMFGGGTLIAETGGSVGGLDISSGNLVVSAGTLSFDDLYVAGAFATISGSGTVEFTGAGEASIGALALNTTFRVAEDADLDLNYGARITGDGKIDNFGNIFFEGGKTTLSVDIDNHGDIDLNGLNGTTLSLIDTLTNRGTIDFGTDSSDSVKINGGGDFIDNGGTFGDANGATIVFVDSTDFVLGSANGFTLSQTGPTLAFNANTGIHTGLATAEFLNEGVLDFDSGTIGTGVVLDNNGRVIVDGLQVEGTLDTRDGTIAAAHGEAGFAINDGGRLIVGEDSRFENSSGTIGQGVPFISAQDGAIVEIAESETVDLDALGSFDFSDGGTLDVGGVWQVNGTSTISDNASLTFTGDGSIVNAGYLFLNNDTVDVDIVNYDDSQEAIGTVDFDASTVLNSEIDGGTVIVSGGTLSGMGTLTNQDALELSASAVLAVNADLGAGTLFYGDGATITSALDLTSGTLRGAFVIEAAAELEVSGTNAIMSISDDTLLESGYVSLLAGATLKVAAGSDLDLASDGYQDFYFQDGGTMSTLSLEGDVRFTDTSYLLDNSGSVEVSGPGTLTVTQDGDLNISNDTLAVAVQNAGTISFQSTANEIEGTVTNTGTIAFQSNAETDLVGRIDNTGTIVMGDSAILRGDGTGVIDQDGHLTITNGATAQIRDIDLDMSHGTLTATDGALLRIDDGAITVGTNMVFNHHGTGSDGTLLIGSGGTLNILAGETITTTDEELNVKSGTIAGTGLLRNHGTLDLTDAVIAEGAQVSSTGSIDISTEWNGGTGLILHGTLTNQNTLDVGAANLSIGTTGTLINNYAMDFSGSALTVDGVLNNQDEDGPGGEIPAPTFTLANNSTLTGSGTLANDGHMVFGGSSKLFVDHFENAGTAVFGYGATINVGDFDLSGGTLDYSSGSVVVTGGTIDATNGALVADSIQDNLIFSGGKLIVGSGTTLSQYGDPLITAYATLSIADGSSFNVHDFSLVGGTVDGSGTLTNASSWTLSNIALGDDLHFVNNGTISEMNGTLHFGRDIDNTNGELRLTNSSNGSTITLDSGGTFTLEGLTRMQGGGVIQGGSASESLMLTGTLMSNNAAKADTISVDMTVDETGSLIVGGDIAAGTDGTLAITGAFRNDGFVQVDPALAAHGVLKITEDFTNTGTLQVDNGASLSVGAGSGTILNTGLMRGYTASESDSETGTLTLGKIDNTGTIALAETGQIAMKWTIDGGWVDTTNGTLHIADGNVLTFDAGTLSVGTNSVLLGTGGTIEFQSASMLDIGAGATISTENYGFDFDDSTISGMGTLEIADDGGSAAFGNTTISATVVNEGTLASVAYGKTAFIDGTFANKSTANLIASGNISITANGDLQNAGTITTFSGWVDVAEGGSFTNSGTLNFAGLASGGSLSLDGTMANSGVLEFSGNGQSDFQIVSGTIGLLDNSGTLLLTDSGEQSSTTLMVESDITNTGTIELDAFLRYGYGEGAAGYNLDTRDGAIIVNSDGELNIRETITVGADTDLSGGGELNVTHGGTMVVATGETFTYSDDEELVGLLDGTITGSGEYINESGTLYVAGGKISVVSFTNADLLLLDSGTLTIDTANFTNRAANGTISAGTIELTASTAQAAVLKLANDLTNDGVIRMTGSLAADNAILTHTASETLTNSLNGTIEVTTGSEPGDRILDLNIVNQGLLKLNNADGTLTAGHLLDTTAGQIDIGTSDTLVVKGELQLGSVTNLTGAGPVDVQGLLSVAAGQNYTHFDSASRFDFSTQGKLGGDGTFTNLSALDITNATLSIAGFQNSGTVSVATGDATITTAGFNNTGGHLNVTGLGVDSMLYFDASMTSAGSITVNASDAAAGLVSTSQHAFTLTNAGYMEFTGGGAGNAAYNILAVDVVNTGTISVDGYAEIRNLASLDTSNGKLEIAPSGAQGLLERLDLDTGATLVVGTDTQLAGNGTILFGDNSTLSIGANENFTYSGTGAVLDLNQWDSIAVTGAGTFTNTTDLSLGGATLSVGTLVNQGSITSTTGTLHFDGSTLTNSNNNGLSSLTLTGSGKLINTFGTTLSMDDMEFANGMTAINNGVMTLDTDETMSVLGTTSGMTISSTGVFQHIGDTYSYIRLNDGGRMVNQGMIGIGGTEGVVSLFNNSGADGTFSNVGTISFSNTSNRLSVGSNTTLTFQSGTAFAGAAGIISVSNGAALAFDTNFDMDGSVEFTALVEGPPVTMSGTGTVTNSGGLDNLYGFDLAMAKFINASNLNLSGGAISTDFLNSAATGQMTLTNGGTLTLDSTLTNAGQLDLGNAEIAGTGTLINTGTIGMTATSQSLTADVSDIDFHNQGTITLVGEQFGQTTASPTLSVAHLTVNDGVIEFEPGRISEPVLRVGDAAGTLINNGELNFNTGSGTISGKSRIDGSVEFGADDGTMFVNSFQAQAHSTANKVQITGDLTMNENSKLVMDLGSGTNAADHTAYLDVGGTTTWGGTFEVRVNSDYSNTSTDAITSMYEAGNFMRVRIVDADTGASIGKNDSGDILLPSFVGTGFKLSTGGLTGDLETIEDQDAIQGSVGDSGDNSFTLNTVGDREVWYGLDGNDSFTLSNGGTLAFLDGGIGDVDILHVQSDFYGLANNSTNEWRLNNLEALDYTGGADGTISMTQDFAFALSEDVNSLVNGLSIDASLKDDALIIAGGTGQTLSFTDAINWTATGTTVSLDHDNQNGSDSYAIYTASNGAHVYVDTDMSVNMQSTPV